MAASTPVVRRWACAGARYLGVGFGELAGFMWGELALDAAPRPGIRLERQRHSKAGGSLRPTKGGRAILLPLAHPLVAALPLVRRRWLDDLGREPTSGDSLFPSIPSNPTIRLLCSNSALRWRHEDLEALEIPHPGRPRRLHSTRHWLISTLHSAGAPEAVVRAPTHSDHRTCRKDSHQAYRHVPYADLCRAIDLVKLPVSAAESWPLAPRSSP